MTLVVDAKCLQFGDDSGLMRRILDYLRQSAGPDGWKGHTADALAEKVGAAGGASVSSTIKAWRTRIVDLLHKRANHTLTETSIILSGSGGGGYRLAPNITVEMAEAVPAKDTPILAAKVTPVLPAPGGHRCSFGGRGDRAPEGPGG